MNEALSAAREAMIRFADAEGVLASLVCDPADPDCRYPDVAAVRRDVTVDELLHLIAAIPDTGEDDRGEEASALYPMLLELAEAFDVFIEQTSLVHGDAVALAESMEVEWHAMSGSGDPDPSSGDPTDMAKRLVANLETLPGLLDIFNRLSAEAKREVAARSEREERLPWRAEARHLAALAVEAWLPSGVSNPHVLKAVELARAGSRARSTGGAAAPLTRASADLVLARLVRGIARDAVPDALEKPFTGLFPGL